MEWEAEMRTICDEADASVHGKGFIRYVCYNHQETAKLHKQRKIFRT